MSVDVTTKLMGVLQKHLRLVEDGQTIPLDKNLEELGLDSMSAVNLLLDLEDTFSVFFPDAMLTEETFRTAGALQAAVSALVGG